MEEDVSNNIDEVYNFFLNNNECSKNIFKCKIKGCKIIVVTPLAGSEIIHEIELIIPADHKFIAVKDDKNTDAWKSYEVPNNIDNKNNICIDPNDYVGTKKLILLPNEKIIEAIGDLERLNYSLNI